MPLHGFHNTQLLDNFDPTVAFGGSISDIVIGDIPWRVHTFTSVGTTSLYVDSSGDLSYMEYLVVAGGGGGGSGGANVGGGGGGAGGYRVGTLAPAANTSYTVTVGAAGAANSGRGGDSVFGSITSTGGGPGDGVGGDSASNGGSGGGATGNLTRGLGTAGQGNNGGTGSGTFGTTV
jgi:hypothetical protein